MGCVKKEAYGGLASARDMAAQRGDPLEDKDLFLAARAHSNPRLAALAISQCDTAVPGNAHL